MKKLVKMFAQKALKLESRTMKVAGVTYKNDDGIGRQSILHKIYKSIDEFDNVDFILELKEESYKDKPAFAVLVNNLQIGYVPSRNVNWCYKNDITNVGGLRVYGGGKDDDGKWLNYGAKITIVVRKRE